MTEKKHARSLPFDKPRAPFPSKRSRKDFNDLRRDMRSLVRRFGFRRVLNELVDNACEQTLLMMRSREPGQFYAYREAGTLLSHAVTTLDELIRLERENRKLTEDA